MSGNRTRLDRVAGGSEDEPSGAVPGAVVYLTGAEGDAVPRAVAPRLFGAAAYAWVDADGRVAGASEGASDALGRTLTRLLGRPIGGLLAERLGRPPDGPVLRRVAAGGRARLWAEGGRDGLVLSGQAGEDGEGWMLALWSAVPALSLALSDAQERDMVYAIGEALMAGTDARTSRAAALLALRRAVGLDVVRFDRLGEDGEIGGHVVVGSASEGGAAIQGPVPLESPIYRAMSGGGTSVARFRRPSAVWGVPGGVCWMVSVPVLVAGRIVGVLSLADARRVDLPVDVNARLERLAAYLGAAWIRLDNIQKQRTAAVRHQAVLDTATDAVVTIDERGRIQETNRSAETTFGWERGELVGQAVEVLMPRDVALRHPETIARYFAGRGSGALSGGVRVVGQRKDGSQFPVDLSIGAWTVGGRRYVSAILRDATELVASEERVRQSSKLEAMGQLTGGMAHDFNNLLAIVHGNLELLATVLPPDPAVHALLQDAASASERGAALVRRLLTFARKQHLSPESVDVDSLINGVLDLLRPTLGESVVVETELCAGAARVHVDPSALENALVNLAVNARDAMPGGGRLVIRTVEVPGTSEAGGCVLISVTDSGAGMSEAVRDRVFDPFFTTKGEGKGSGLGLSMVYGFVKQSMGRIELRSAPGEGSEFQLYLPLLAPTASAASPAPRPASPCSSRPLKILVVEDSLHVRRVAVRLLTSLGHSVLEADGGEQALDRIALAPDIDLVFSDVVLGGDENGPAIAEQIRACLPDVRVLFVSGYSGDDLPLTVPADGSIHLLQKPYTRRELAAKLAVVMGATPRG